MLNLINKEQLMNCKLILAGTFLGVTLSSLAFADNRTSSPEQLDKRSDRIEQRLDNRGDRIENRMDARADKARAAGNEEKADRLERKDDRVDKRLDNRGERINNRLDHRASRHN